MASLEDLLAKGYFPRELPPPFRTASLATAIAAAVRGAKLPPSFTFSHHTSKYCRHSLARSGNLRRRLSIPNPVHQYSLSALISDEWQYFLAQAKRSPISKSTPSYFPGKNRAILPQHPQSELPSIRASARGSARYALRTDISEFYQSIYTHSLPWALHTKSVAKVSRKDNTLLGNRLDRLLQSSQDSQTNGIPIGPDTSLVVAEVLLSAVDLELSKAQPRLVGFRYLDDYELTFPTLAAADAALAAIQACLMQFELRINPAKTDVVALPCALEEPFVNELRTFEFRGTKKTQARDIIHYFDKVFECFDRFPRTHVIKYSISTLRKLKADESNWELLQSLLSQVLAVDGSAIKEVLTQIAIYSELAYEMNLDLWRSALNSVIEYHAPLGHGYEVAWATWGLMEMALKIEVSNAGLLSKMDDVVVALLALAAEQRGLIQGGLDTARWQALMTTDELYEDNWLLVYEAGVSGWLRSNRRRDHISGDPNFTFLRDSGVRFYEDTPLSILAGSIIMEDTSQSAVLAPAAATA